MADAATAAVAEHYDQTRSAGPNAPTEFPDPGTGTQAPPAAETPDTAPQGAEKEAPNERPQH